MVGNFTAAITLTSKNGISKNGLTTNKNAALQSYLPSGRVLFRNVPLWASKGFYVFVNILQIAWTAKSDLKPIDLTEQIDYHIHWTSVYCFDCFSVKIYFPFTFCRRYCWSCQAWHDIALRSNVLSISSIKGLLVSVAAKPVPICLFYGLIDTSAPTAIPGVFIHLQILCVTRISSWLRRSSFTSNAKKFLFFCFFFLCGCRYSFMFKCKAHPVGQLASHFGDFTIQGP